jgi:hypothetical protein
MEYNLKLFGFVPKLFTSDRLEDCVYLGMRPYPTKSGWLWGKTIGRATYKLGWVTIKGDQDLMALMTGIADMHALCSRHVPVLSDIARKIVELRRGAKRTQSSLTTANRGSGSTWSTKSTTMRSLSRMLPRYTQVGRSQASHATRTWTFS